MAFNRVQVEMESDSGLPEDVVVNTWHFFTTGTKLDSDAVLVNTALGAFYGTIDASLSSRLSGAATITWYDLADPPPRVPWLVSPLTITPGSTALPAELAICLSFQAQQQSGQPQARRRGRLYLGPWAATAHDNATGRPDTSVINQIATAAATLLSASNAAPEWAWDVFSRVDGTSRRVDNGWVDNAWDVQRRRGIAPTIRQLFP